MLDENSMSSDARSSRVSHQYLVVNFAELHAENIVRW